MKTNIRSTSIFLAMTLLATSIFWSCDKNEDKNDSKCLISSYINFDENVCSGETNFISESFFTYDNNDLLVRWDWGNNNISHFYYNGNGQIELIEEQLADKPWTLRLTWNGNEVTRHWYEGDIPSSVKTVVEFNSSKEIVRVDAYLNYENEWVLERYEIYTWLNGNVVKIEQYYDSENGTKNLIIGKKRNMIAGKPIESDFPDKEDISMQKTKNSSNNFVLHYIHTMSYDDKHNPLGRHEALSIRNLYNLLYHSRNNIVASTTEKVCCDEVVTTTSNYSWEYNSQNYPVKRKVVGNNEEDCDWTGVTDFRYGNCD